MKVVMLLTVLLSLSTQIAQPVNVYAQTATSDKEESVEDKVYTFEKDGMSFEIEVYLDKALDKEGYEGEPEEGNVFVTLEINVENSSNKSQRVSTDDFYLTIAEVNYSGTDFVGHPQNGEHAVPHGIEIDLLAHFEVPEYIAHANDLVAQYRPTNGNSFNPEVLFEFNVAEYLQERDKTKSETKESKKRETKEIIKTIVSKEEVVKRNGEMYYLNPASGIYVPVYRNPDGSYFFAPEHDPAYFEARSRMIEEAYYNQEPDMSAVYGEDWQTNPDYNNGYHNEAPVPYEEDYYEDWSDWDDWDNDYDY